MLNLTFQVLPKPGHHDNYFNTAAALKPRLDAHEGLLHLERYTHVANPDAVLSHQFWQDETAILNWRKDAIHYRAQVAGRNTHFDDYRIRVSEILHHRQELPVITQQLRHASMTTENRLYLVGECDTALGFSAREHYQSVTRDKAELCLFGPTTADALLEALPHEANATVQWSLARTVRDYTLADRAEAPQEFS